MAERQTTNRRRVDSSIFEVIGESGLKRWGNFVAEERIQMLQGPEGMQQYREMSEDDAVVGAMLYAIEQILRTVTWEVEPGGKDQIDIEKADFLRSCMEDTSHTWSDFISEVLSFLTFGWAWAEIIYKIRLGPNNKDPRKRSKFNDGRIGWRALAIRAQTTLDGWDFEEDGGVRGWWQRTNDGRRVYLPIEKGLLFRTKISRNNPEGRSVLRSAWHAWRFKKNLEIIEAIGIERNLVGLPVAYLPVEYFDPDAPPETKAVLKHVQQIVTNLRVDESAGIVFPRDPANPEAFEITLLSHSGRTSMSDIVSGPINRYAQQIAMSVLADVILLGHGQVGSYALSTTKTDLFGFALKAFVDSIQQVLNQYAVPRLFALNAFPETEKLPRFVHGNVMVPDLNQLGQYIYRLAQAGMELFPDPRLEDELLRVASLPPRVREQDKPEDVLPPDEADEAENGDNEQSTAKNTSNLVRNTEKALPNPNDMNQNQFSDEFLAYLEQRIDALERAVRAIKAGGDG